MTTQTKTTINGIDVNQLIETIDAVKNQPGIAEFRFRATNHWVKGGHSRTEIKSFFGAGQEDSSREKSFVLDGDEPPVLLGENRGPNAVETVLHALASCLAVGFVYNASALNIEVESLEMNLEGTLDLHGFLGISEKVRPGYEKIQLSCNVKADAPKDKLDELMEHVQKTSPVLDIIRNPVPVSVNLKKV